jgi:polyribonucleotide 5'-hydroxyl-kinase
MHAGSTAGGMVINTMGFVEGLGYELLLHAIRTFRVDRVLVMQQDRLQAQLTKDLR